MWIGGAAQNERAYVLVLVLGLRKGEMLGTTWDRIDLDVGEIMVDVQLQRAGHELLHRETKTPTSDDALPSRTSAQSLCKSGPSLRRQPKRLRATHGIRRSSSSRPASERRSSRATSTATGTGGVTLLASVGSPSGMLGAPAPP
ncbi:hypothetical protein Ahu01nite_026110 [Winogradskya humida]|uniref:Phage integrase family protein n=1 Tax=Winogradskya humida TaxID=113566 RepID=A0ABQ3ZLN9_9ACTN|nr:hypothetical protein Ahu01nite_026110 [Actinoplanes humidus]